ncbi:D-alanyl-D-alanine endopeptidase [Rhodoferax sp.]|uniref:D-alanyl-D-alanine endopeptidase n=1 Tax=Rhodoferax sp. TaxID=50421 RepID=UPI00374DDB77
MRKILFFFGLTLFIFAVSLPQADAAQKKRQLAKSAKSTIVAKSSKSSRFSKSSISAKRKVSKTFVATKHKTVSHATAAPLKPSFGQMAGLHGATDSLDLKSSVALVIDQETNEVLFSKNEQAVLPIASLTKLMTGLVLREAKLPMDQMITISQADVDTEKGSKSRLGVGTELTRGELLHLALMSSENRAAHALARSYPGGLSIFVGLMNAKALSIGMSDTQYVEPTGLSSKNQSSARDLAKLVNIAHSDPILRELTTSPDYQVAVGNRTLQFNNTNRLVKNPSWDIGLQKTGYISEAGRCLVMQTKIAGRKLIMVFLDSAGKLSRIADAERVRRWVESRSAGRSTSVPLASAAGEKIIHFQ